MNPKNVDTCVFEYMYLKFNIRITVKFFIVFLFKTPYQEWLAWAHLPRFLLSLQYRFSPMLSLSGLWVNFGLLDMLNCLLIATNFSAYSWAFAANEGSHWISGVSTWSSRNLLCAPTQMAIKNRTVKCDINYNLLNEYGARRNFHYACGNLILFNFFFSMFQNRLKSNITK